MLSIFCLKSLLLTLHMTAGHDVAASQAISSTTEIGKVYACPRCRRATPPGPRKRSIPKK